MTDNALPQDDSEVVAHLRLALERPTAALDDVLRGALILSRMGYRALATEYATRILKEARDENLRQTARAVLLSWHTSLGVA